MRPLLGVLLLVGVACTDTRSSTPSANAVQALVPATTTTTTTTTTTDAGRDVRTETSHVVIESAPTTTGAASTPPPTNTTTTSTTTSTTVPEPRTISMAFTGDTLTHSPLWRQATRNAEADGEFDFRPMLAELRPLIEPVDLAICHLETPIAPVSEELSTNPFYGVPAEIVDAIASAGYDRCSTASNHAADRGIAGVDRTVDVLEAAGVGQSGMAREPNEITPQVFDIQGVAVSHLSYTFSYNGLSFPDEEPWRSSVIDPTRITADAAAARALGAELVIVSMHWGEEKQHEPTYGQRRIADEITASGDVDLIVGHHAHVVQPIELINDTWVLFGTGNILSNLPTSDSWPAASQDAVVVTIDATVDATGAVSFARPVVYPTWVDHDAGWVVRLVDAELARTDISTGQRGRLERSRERTARVLSEFLAQAPVS